jgi:thioredoxin-like negative regulator of GroEL
MRKLNSIEAIEKEIESGAKLLYVSAPNCNVCDALKIKVKALFGRDFPKIELLEANIAEVPEIAGRFNIFSAPAMLIFFDGQEFVREGRNVSLELLAQKLQKIYEVYFS